MSAAPKVSVLIPTYNFARYLPDAIESVLAQDFGDIEVIVSDDASPDASEEVGREYAARDTRIRFHRHERNIGMVQNWNWCLGEARGEYCKFVFGDDCLVSNRAVGRMAEMLDGAPEAVLAATARLVVDEESRPAEVWDDLRHSRVYPGLDIISRCLWEDRNLVGEPSAVMFRRASASRGFDLTLRQVVDLEMWFHLLLGGDLVYDAFPLCGFRQHAAQQTVVNRRSHVGPVESLTIADRYMDILGDLNCLSPFALRYICYRCLYYSRKRSPRLPEIIRMESALRSRLPARWRGILWLLHRCTKPFSNLGRAWLRFRGRRNRPPLAQSSAARLRWTPR